MLEMNTILFRPHLDMCRGVVGLPVKKMKHYTKLTGAGKNRAQWYANKRTQVMAFGRLGRGVHLSKSDLVLLVLAITLFLKHYCDLRSIEKVVFDYFHYLFFLLLFNTNLFWRNGEWNRFGVAESLIPLKFLDVY